MKIKICQRSNCPSYNSLGGCLSAQQRGECEDILVKERVIFNLKTYWQVAGKTVNLYEEIKAGRKTIEYRDCTRFWITRLCGNHIHVYGPQDLTEYLKVNRAWFVRGYPKDCLPRLEADITGLKCNDAMQLEIAFANVKEVTSFASYGKESRHDKMNKKCFGQYYGGMKQCTRCKQSIAVQCYNKQFGKQDDDCGMSSC